MEQQARQLLTILHAAGFQAYWVGGCVRDLLLGKPLKDIDIATDAHPEQVADLFPDSRFVGVSFGVTLVVIDRLPFEVATFRRDGTYSDQRRPDTIAYGTLTEDAHRRDFTVNALYYNPLTEEIIDPVGGRADLTAGILRAVGDADLRFREDALRMLRAIRFAAKLDFQIEAETWRALKRHAPSVQSLSGERIRDELTRMLTDVTPSRAFRLMDEAGLLALILPEITALKGVEQGAQYHPEGDVFVHTMLVIDNLEPKTPAAAWAALLHDVGKPATFQKEGDKITFYQHEKVGAEMAKEIGRRLRFPFAFAGRVSSIVDRHMRFMHAHQWKTSTLRRFIAAETIEEDLAVHRADCMSAHCNLTAWEYVSGQLAHARANPEGPKLPPPILTGHDLMALGLSPGPQFRLLLDMVSEWQLNGEVTSREQALEKLKEHLQNGEIRQEG